MSWRELAAAYSPSEQWGTKTSIRKRYHNFWLNGMKLKTAGMRQHSMFIISPHLSVSCSDWVQFIIFQSCTGVSPSFSRFEDCLSGDSPSFPLSENSGFYVGPHIQRNIRSKSRNLKLLQLPHTSSNCRTILHHIVGFSPSHHDKKWVSNGTLRLQVLRFSPSSLASDFELRGMNSLYRWSRELIGWCIECSIPVLDSGIWEGVP